MQAGSIVASLSLFCLLAFAAPGAAHPLGNFSISQYAALKIAADSIALRYVIDMAEIPAFQEIQNAGIPALANEPETQDYLSRRVLALREGLSLELNGRPLALHPASKEIIFPPGAGGLPTLKLGVSYMAKLPAAGNNEGYALTYRDNNFPGRAGWKEIIVVAQPGIRLNYSSAPEADRSQELSDYPTDFLNSPPQQLEAAARFMIARVGQRVSRIDSARPTDSAAGSLTPRPEIDWKNQKIGRLPAETTDAGRHDSIPARTQWAQPLPQQSHPASPGPVSPLQPNRNATPRDSFTELLAAGQLEPGLVLVALAVAIALGAFHALEPGHGKTLVAAYLVGSRGTMKHALLLGLIVTAAHTAGVYLLGGATLYASQYIVPERLYPWLGVVSGVMITVLGAFLVVRRCRGIGPAHTHHHHDHGQHNHQHHRRQPHEHGHEHPGHAHHHHEAASRRQLLALGISGGIVPCPAALVVLLSAVALNRAAFGLLLIAAFSAGLATVLIAVGLLTVYARRFMARLPMNGLLTTRWLPLASSAVIFLVGAAFTWRALQSAGWAITSPL